MTRTSTDVSASQFSTELGVGRVPRVVPDEAHDVSLARFPTASTTSLKISERASKTNSQDPIPASVVYNGTLSLPNSASSIYTLSTAKTYPCQKAAALPPRNFDLQHEFLRIFEPSPVEPPAYSSLVPGGCPRFPTYSSLAEAASLDTKLTGSCALLQLPSSDFCSDPPIYSPSVYKLTVIIRKVEWLSPFEAAPIRRWKYYIMELNSTQLNFYLIPSALEGRVLRYLSDPDSFSCKVDNKAFEDEIDVRRSGMTTEADLCFYRMCRRLNLIPINNIASGGRHSRLSALKFWGSLLNPKRLVRSYSLQHATFGLASDYTKRKNVLRARLESEQILLHFHNTQDLIDWEVALGVGSGIALDLVDRELPRFKTVPRRRRRRALTDMHEYTPGDFSTAVASGTRRRGLTGGPITASFRSRMHDLCSLFNTPLCERISQNQLHTLEANEASRLKLADSEGTPIDYLGAGSGPNQENLIAHNASDDEDDEDDTFTLESNPLTGESDNLSQLSIDITQEDEGGTRDRDIDSIEAILADDLWQGDLAEVDKLPTDLSQELSDDDSWIEGADSSSCDTGDSTDHKWNPLANLQPNPRKLHRNCLRCIRVLTNYDPWFSKCVVKPAVVSPFILNYLNFIPNQSDRSSSLLSEPVLRDRSTLNAYLQACTDSGIKPSKLRAFCRLNVLPGNRRLQKNGLARMPCHYVREYVVGSHVLIPKVL